jgi:hypothetical protein
MNLSNNIFAWSHLQQIIVPLVEVHALPRNSIWNAIPYSFEIYCTQGTLPIAHDRYTTIPFKAAWGGGGELIVNVLDHDDPGPHSLESSTKHKKQKWKINWDETGLTYPIDRGLRAS